jgi:Brp/Blh family beta-carotene 15,15'-monooxygenase
MISSLIIFWFLIGVNSEFQLYSGWIILSIGMALVGFPHGALDHVIEQSAQWNLRLVKFILIYLTLMTFMGLIWWWNSMMALGLFMLFSVWHFGQSDGVYWKLSRPLSMLWGASVLFFILGSHAQESSSILANLGYVGMVPKFQWIFGLPWLGLALWKRNTNWVLTLVWLSLTSYLPLLMAFGLYFIGQHSIVGWMHLKKSFELSHVNMWKKALPFQLGAWIFLGFFLYYRSYWMECSSISSWALFFIFISCVSSPHIMVMNRFYQRFSRI